MMNIGAISMIKESIEKSTTSKSRFRFFYREIGKIINPELPIGVYWLCDIDHYSVFILNIK